MQIYKNKWQIKQSEFTLKHQRKQFTAIGVTELYAIIVWNRCEYTQTQNVLNSFDTDSIEKYINHESLWFIMYKNKTFGCWEIGYILKKKPIDMHDFERVLFSLNTTDVNNLSKNIHL